MMTQQIMRANLVDAAKDLNAVMGLSPEIDVKLGVAQLRTLVAEASRMVKEGDAISEATRTVVEELLSEGVAEDTSGDAKEGVAHAEVDEEVAGADASDAKSPKVKAPKEKKVKAVKVVVAKAPKEKIVKEKKVAAPKAQAKAKAVRTRGSKMVEDKTPETSPKPFKPVRHGSIRARLIDLMDGTRTVQQLAESVGKSASNTSCHVYCIWRDSGIGYSYDAEGRVRVLPPAGKRVADLVAPVA